NKNFGSGAGSVCEGNDARLSNARAPTAHTHGNADLTELAAWAKAAIKPAYTPSEIGAATTLQGQYAESAFLLAQEAKEDVSFCIKTSGLEEMECFSGDDSTVILDYASGFARKISMYRLASGLQDYMYLDGSRVDTHNLYTRNLRFEDESSFDSGYYMVVNKTEYHYYNGNQDYWTEEKTVRVTINQLISLLKSLW
ncbi:MAG: hypothetical protein FWE74_11180, partial [Oscillospiraceae bacterium]|nr:hypothetical protein [Oscillospiraceae bacterium]